MFFTVLLSQISNDTSISRQYRICIRGTVLRNRGFFYRRLGAFFFAGTCLSFSPRVIGIRRIVAAYKAQYQDKT